MGVSTSVVKGLIQRNINALHVKECLPITSEDSIILDFALKENRIVITLDHDFGDLLYVRRSKSPSVVFLRLLDQTPNNVLEKLDVVFSKLETELLEGAIVTVKDNHIRFKMLPLRS